MSNPKSIKKLSGLVFRTREILSARLTDRYYLCAGHDFVRKGSLHRLALAHRGDPTGNTWEVTLNVFNGKGATSGTLSTWTSKGLSETVARSIFEKIPQEIKKGSA